MAYTVQSQFYKLKSGRYLYLHMTERKYNMLFMHCWFPLFSVFSKYSTISNYLFYKKQYVVYNDVSLRIVRPL